MPISGHRDAIAPACVSSVQEIPSGQANLPTRLIEASTHPYGVVIPQEKQLAVQTDCDPAVLLHRDDRAVAVRVGLSVTGEGCLDEVSLMTWRV